MKTFSHWKIKQPFCDRESCWRSSNGSGGFFFIMLGRQGGNCNDHLPNFRKTHWPGHRPLKGTFCSVSEPFMHAETRGPFPAAHFAAAMPGSRVTGAGMKRSFFGNFPGISHPPDPIQRSFARMSSDRWQGRVRALQRLGR
eukprot:scaffold1541_cov256-Pinguiococcus_pyrenoidosus.AAC.1